MIYDYLIVGSGLFGTTMAYLLHQKGYKCLVIDKRSHIGGNVYTESVNGINVHKYGAHIFHTSDRRVWEFVNSLVEFNRYTNSPVANYKGKLYNLPFNMNTFYQIWGVTTPQEAQCKIEQQRTQSDIEPVNLEEQAISLVGRDIYEILIKGYTEKQWGKKATELPPSIIKRIPVRFVFDNNYFNDVYQGIPKQGYTSIIKKMLLGSDVILNTDYFERKDYFDSIAHTVIYTGEVDRYFNYCYGKLEYRSLLFETIFLKGIANYQGNAVVNYTDCETPYTRIIEHKHFEFGNQSDTMITKEFPFAFSKDSEPYYPINDERNNYLYSRYARLVRQEKNVYFGGRLAEYKYYNMDQVIRAALNLNRIILSIS